jgi:hypothetical protein
VRADFLKHWVDNHYKSGASVNPPGVMARALNVAVLKLHGHAFKDGVFGGPNGTAIYIPIPLIDNSNVQKAYDQVKDKPRSPRSPRPTRRSRSTSRTERRPEGGRRTIRRVARVEEHPVGSENGRGAATN